ncbi:MAG TPA: Gfo/Idh/MocA family oxidoreductase [Dehalococcoidia bacterium]|nr:Gfo/Idh/MocA family oxidoreductase [Dehalococcoidia bacterium]
MSEPIGVAVIGTGSIANAHLYAYQKSDRARLVAVADIEETRAKEAASRFEAERTFADIQNVLALDEVQAVSICTPPFLHTEMAIAALNAGKHVFCEKPVAPTLGALDAIAAAEAASSVSFSGVFQLRYGRGAQQVRRLLDEGCFGRLHLGIAETLWFRDHDYYEVPWRGTWASECGGVTVSQAIHLIDALICYLGEPVSVYAQGGTFRTRTEIDDTMVALIRFPGGAIGQVTSTVSAFGQERGKLEIYGTDLTAVSQGTAYDATAELFSLGSPVHGHAAEWAVRMEAGVPKTSSLLHRPAIEDFLQCIQEGRRPPIGVDECRKVLQVTTAIYKSAMTGEVVHLPIQPGDAFYDYLPPEGMSLPPVADREAV